VAAAAVLRQQLGSRAYHSKHGIGRKQFYESLDGTKKASAGDCVCGTCLEHGHKNFQDAEELLREMQAMHVTLITEITGGSAVVAAVTTEYAALRQRLLGLRNFLNGNFQQHLIQASEEGSHCMQAALASKNQPEEMAECNHAKGGGTTAQAVADAKVAIEGWSDEKGGWGECGVCDNRGGIAYMCDFYSSATHHKCLSGRDKLPWQLRTTAGTFKCDDCTRDFDEVNHQMQCSECMEIWSLLDRKEVWQEADDLGVGTTRERWRSTVSKIKPGSDARAISSATAVVGSEALTTSPS
jgi:hypothetical protein